MTDREWTATHCIECHDAPEWCDRCGCHTDPETGPDGHVSAVQTGYDGERKTAPAGNRGLTKPTVEES